MMTKQRINKAAIIRIVIVIPLSLLLIAAIASCSASRKKASTRNEISPPPPPPAPPTGDAPTEVFVICEEMPVFPGGDAALAKFISDNIRYPEDAKAKKTEGRVIVRFCVTYQGKVRDIMVLKGVDPALDNEAVRVMKLLPDWKPGMQGGKPVNVWYTTPISFSLSGGGQFPPKYRVSGNDTIYFSPQEPPQFIGGKEALAKFKSDNLKINKELLDAGFTGNVSVTYIIGKDGKMSNISISGGVSPSSDAEALRVVKMLPDWIPGKENGRPVITRSSMIFNFYPETPAGEAPKEVFVVVEEMPVFPGGDTALIGFISRNIRYPKESKEKGIQGRVILRFCVNYKGGIEQVGVLKGVDPAIDAEAIRVIKMIPEWIPGKQGGKPVNVWYSVPVTFALKDDGPKGNMPAGNNVPPPPPPPPPAAPTAPSLVYGYDEPPLFPGGEKALIAFIESNKKYPASAKDSNIKGTVKIRFTVTETGKVESANIFSSIDPALDTEALRVVSLLPSWEPGKLQGKPARVTYTVPVTFK